MWKGSEGVPVQRAVTGSQSGDEEEEEEEEENLSVMLIFYKQMEVFIM